MFPHPARRSAGLRLTPALKASRANQRGVPFLGAGNCCAARSYVQLWGMMTLPNTVAAKTTKDTVNAPETVSFVALSRTMDGCETPIRRAFTSEQIKNISRIVKCEMTLRPKNWGCGISALRL